MNGWAYVDAIHEAAEDEAYRAEMLVEHVLTNEQTELEHRLEESPPVYMKFVFDHPEIKAQFDAYIKQKAVELLTEACDEYQRDTRNCGKHCRCDGCDFDVPEARHIDLSRCEP